VFVQLIAYYIAIFLYVRKRKKYLQDNYSDSDYIEIRWTQSFLFVFFLLFCAVFVAYAIDPRSDTWLIPILNVIAMGYLVYVVIRHSTAEYLNRMLDMPVAVPERESVAAPAMDEVQMREICDKVLEYLQASKAYLDPDLSIHTLAGATGLARRSISSAINGYLHQNFFDFINAQRVGEAKRRLLALNSEYTADSVFPDCGFRSRSVFYSSFNKLEGISPVKWLKNNKR
jgi:AraC-like DNA-binding protein